MVLVFYPPEEENDILKEFVLDIMPTVQTLLYKQAELLRHAYKKAEEYLVVKGILPKTIHIQDLINTAIENLQIVYTQQDIRIQLNEVLHTGKYNISRIIRSLEYGYYVQPILLFRNVFDEIQQTQDELYNSWVNRKLNMVVSDVFV